MALREPSTVQQPGASGFWSQATIPPRPLPSYVDSTTSGICDPPSYPSSSMPLARPMSPPARFHPSSSHFGSPTRYQSASSVGPALPWTLGSVSLPMNGSINGTVGRQEASPSPHQRSNSKASSSKPPQLSSLRSCPSGAPISVGRHSLHSQVHSQHAGMLPFGTSSLISRTASPVMPIAAQSISPGSHHTSGTPAGTFTVASGPPRSRPSHNRSFSAQSGSPDLEKVRTSKLHEKHKLPQGTGSPTEFHAWKTVPPSANSVLSKPAIQQLDGAGSPTDFHKLNTLPSFVNVPLVKTATQPLERSGKAPFLQAPIRGKQPNNSFPARHKSKQASGITDSLKLAARNSRQDKFSKSPGPALRSEPMSPVDQAVREVNKPAIYKSDPFKKDVLPPKAPVMPPGQPHQAPQIQSEQIPVEVQPPMSEPRSQTDRSDKTSAELPVSLTPEVPDMAFQQSLGPQLQQKVPLTTSLVSRLSLQTAQAKLQKQLQQEDELQQQQNQPESNEQPVLEPQQLPGPLAAQPATTCQRPEELEPAPAPGIIPAENVVLDVGAAWTEPAVNGTEESVNLVDLIDSVPTKMSVELESSLEESILQLQQPADIDEAPCRTELAGNGLVEPDDGPVPRQDPTQSIQDSAQPRKVSKQSAEPFRTPRRASLSVMRANTDETATRVLALMQKLIESPEWKMALNDLDSKDMPNQNITDGASDDFGDGVIARLTRMKESSMCQLISEEARASTQREPDLPLEGRTERVLSMLMQLTGSEVLQWPDPEKERHRRIMENMQRIRQVILQENLGRIARPGAANEIQHDRIWKICQAIRIARAIEDFPLSEQPS